MKSVDRWLLPDGIEELLPGPAARVEHLRRSLLDLHQRWGYQLVMPPLVEFTESLLIGLGSDIDMLTFRITDQASGRGMGIRADITPQVARIDAHSLAEAGVSRYCYAGSVLHTRPTAVLGSRSPIKLGAELYGDASLQADIEIISLMLETLQTAGVDRLTLDLGHVGICRQLLANSGLEPSQQTAIYDALQRKSLPDLQSLLADVPGSDALRALAGLHGGIDILSNLPEQLDDTAIVELQDVAAAITERYPEVDLYFDLAELRGYQYHTGLVFSAYVPGQGKALANGGRYDDVGEVFGRPRPATGFNTDLKTLLDITDKAIGTAPAPIAAPADGDAGLWAAIGALRDAGEIVIQSLSGETDARCNRVLVQRDGQWTVEEQI
ncbi:MAG: ATP phosphoribosyltransferase regulatory subunit [Pseudomonadota bacterium]